MKKIIILVIAAAVLLMGAKALIAQKEGKPRQKQKEMLRAERKGKVREEARDQEREQVEDRDVVRDRPKVAPEGPRLPALLPQRPAVQMFGRWLDELTKAYQENDRERMGQLIKRMHQFRQKLQAGGAVPGRPIPDVPIERPDMEEGRPGRFRGPQEGQRDLQPRGMGRMGRPQAPMPSPEGMEGPKPPEQMGGWGRGFGGMGRGMGMGMGRGRGMGMGRGGMGMGRGMGMGPPSAGERPFPGPWCPWWRYQEPEMD